MCCHLSFYLTNVLVNSFFSFFIGHLSHSRLILEFPVPLESSSSPSLPVLPLSSPIISYTYPLYPSLPLLSPVPIPRPPLPSSVITCAPTVTPSLLLSLPVHAFITPAFPFIPCMVCLLSEVCGACYTQRVLLSKIMKLKSSVMSFYKKQMFL